jgi:hypothetical protein
MVTTASHYSDARNRALVGEGYDGVVRVSVAGRYGTGVLLHDGRTILTAAHLFSSGASSATVQFETTQGTQTLGSARVWIFNSYDAANAQGDLALIGLSQGAPTSADRYTLYRQGDEIGQPFTLVGYGALGTGSSGTDRSVGTVQRTLAQNRFDADMADVKAVLGAGMTWSPGRGTQLVADFDDGTSRHDALGQWLGVNDLGLGSREGLVAQGDSGGPAFIGRQLAGIATYVASLKTAAVHPDIDDVPNSSFGEMAAWQRVSAYQQWIDQTLRAAYPNAPSHPSEVKAAVPEGASGASYAYFLLSFHGTRSNPGEILSVDYATRDGTAKAGSDYLATRGTLHLYPGERQAVIAVEILGDAVPEPDETFYLDVTNPVGAGFADGVAMLTGQRVIVNDDGAWG